MTLARAAAIAAAFSAFGAGLNPVAPQHEHHGVPRKPVRLDTLAVRAERDAVQLRSTVTIVETRAPTAASGSIADFLRTVPGV